MADVISISSFLGTRTPSLERTQFVISRSSSSFPQYRPRKSHFAVNLPKVSNKPSSSSWVVPAKEAALPNCPEMEKKRIHIWPLVVSAGISFGSLLLSLRCESAIAAATAVATGNDSIRASKIGLKIATALRATGLADEMVIFALATLPVLELRGAIPVGYWMKLDPFLLTSLSIIGNMVPVPLIMLYLKKLVYILSLKNTAGSRLLERVLQRAKDKAGPVKEFQWLGLMLFVAVPFPGTGAWTGAIISSVLDMPFWTSVSANFVGVVVAGLLINLLVNLGLKYAVVTGLLLFFASTVMWNVLRYFKAQK
ncbi:Small multidrug export protein [Zostera marina]|uniref:Small multidrug export protein n=1 Tax=Zostera marina TaxID=29655 RepID=A0A0K9PQ83_ZOSMR|nr:Small multidrug export protein [Zostera marina]